MQQGVRADINLTALLHNLSVARKHAPHSKVMAVVKSLAYGHGAVEVAKTLNNQADALAIARVNEAVLLREAGIDADLLVLEGVSNAEEVRQAVTHNLQLVIHQPYQIDLLNVLNEASTIHCWLKLDTGMHRLGFSVAEFQSAYDQLKAMSSVCDITLMTHLASADELQNTATSHQLAVMQKATKDLSEPLSMANSAGILAWPESHADWVRPGIMLYGSFPITSSSSENPLQPVMTLRAPLIAIKQLEVGDQVGYGGTWQASEAILMGVVAIGYGDGYPRHIGADACVLINGQRAPIIGRVSMDMITIDLNNVNASIGDDVILWGEGLPADEVAAWANTIAYTLFCGVTSRVPRYYQKED